MSVADIYMQLCWWLGLGFIPPHVCFVTNRCAPGIGGTARGTP